MSVLIVEKGCAIVVFFNKLAQASLKYFSSSNSTPNSNCFRTAYIGLGRRKAQKEILMAGSSSSVEVIWTWSSLIQIAFATGLCTAVFNQGFAWVKEIIQRRQSNRVEGRTFALELVEILTAYAQECNSRIDCNLFDERSGGYGRYTEMPALKPFPEGPWGLLPSSIAAGLRDLRNEVGEASRDIKGAGEVDGHPEAIDAATSRFGTVGYTAVLLAQRLRRHYQLGHYQAAGASTFELQLRRQYRSSHPGLIKRLWQSLPIFRLRRRLSRLRRRLTNAYRRPTYESGA